MTLTDTAIRKAKPSDKVQKLYDAGGLYLEIARSGGKWWRLKYRFGGKEKRLSLGVYPDVSLKDARERRDENRKLLANEIDPGEFRKSKKAATDERNATASRSLLANGSSSTHRTGQPITATAPSADLSATSFHGLALAPLPT